MRFPTSFRSSLLLLAPLTLSACHSGPRSDPRAAEQAVRAADAAWVKAATTGKVENSTAFYSDDAVLLPPNAPPVTGKDAIHKAVAELYAMPGVSITWQPVSVEAVASGELVYEYGGYTMLYDGPAGKRTTELGKFTEVWKRQPDGVWKCRLDMWSPNRA